MATEHHGDNEPRSGDERRKGDRHTSERRECATTDFDDP